MARSLEECGGRTRVWPHTGLGAAPARQQVESGRLSHLEAEIQLGTNHLAKLAKLANRQNSYCQARTPDATCP
jgi:hypothetical protein